jgi:mRNA interferase MazF
VGPRVFKAALTTLMDRDLKSPSESSPDIIRQGDVFWIEADPSRGSIPGSPHPHVVVQEDVFNQSRISTVVVCALTSNLNRATEPGNVLLNPGEGGLEKQSVVVVSQVSSVYKTRLGEHIGTLSHERVQQILAGMRFLQASFHQR